MGSVSYIVKIIEGRRLAGQLVGHPSCYIVEFFLVGQESAQLHPLGMFGSAILKPASTVAPAIS